MIIIQCLIISMLIYQGTHNKFASLEGSSLKSFCISRQEGFKW